MPGIGATDPADLVAQARAEMGLSRQLQQTRRELPHPRDGGSCDRVDERGRDEYDLEMERDAEERTRLHERVLRAAYDAAATSTGPAHLWERKHGLFQLCAAPPKAPRGGGGRRRRRRRRPRRRRRRRRQART